VRDVNNTVVALGGQAVAPESSAKCIGTKKLKWFTLMQRDYQNLPKEWCIRFLKLNFNTTSIGLLDKFDDNNQRIFAVNNTGDAEAFAITLEPAGGSLNPTMEQLYTLGKCNLLKYFVTKKRLSLKVFFFAFIPVHYSFKLFKPVLYSKHSYIQLQFTVLRIH
jgi:hypothetical protein